MSLRSSLSLGLSLTAALLCAPPSLHATPVHAPSAPHRHARTAKPAAERPPLVLDATTQAIIANSTAAYDVLVGELNAQHRQPAHAYAYLMDAARRTGDTRLYARATDMALQARAPDIALRTVAEWKAAAPSDFEAESYRMQIYLLMGRLEDTAAPLQTALTLAPEDKRQELIHALPLLYSQARSPARALDIVAPILQPHQRVAQTAFVSNLALARMQLAARQYPECLSTLQQAVTAPIYGGSLGAAVPNRELPSLVALDLMRNSRISMPKVATAAENMIRHEVARPDASPDLRISYAKVLVEQRRYNDAVTQLDRLISLHPDDPTVWLLQGALQFQLQHWNAADAALQKYLQVRKPMESALIESEGPAPTRLSQSLTLAESDIQAYLLLAEIADMRNDSTAAAQWIARIPSPRARTAAMIQRAEALSRQQKYGPALQLAQELPHKTAADSALRALFISQIQEKTKQYAQAEQTLDQALSSDPDNPELLYARGMIREAQNRLPTAEADLRRVIALKPESAAAYNALGYSLVQRNLRVQEGHDLIAKALRLDPENGAILDSMGWAQYRLGHLEEARQWLDKAFLAEPQPEIAAHLGEVLWRLGKPDAARAIWSEGLKMDAHNAILLETIERLTGHRIP